IAGMACQGRQVAYQIQLDHAIAVLPGAGPRPLAHCVAEQPVVSVTVSVVAETGPEPPLFVDLDGTLVKTDLLLESVLVLIKTRPRAIVLLLFWLLRGRAHLKAEVARRADVAAEGLVYDERVLARLRDERGRGRRLVLATASHTKYAE